MRKRIKYKYVNSKMLSESIFCKDDFYYIELARDTNMKYSFTIKSNSGKIVDNGKANTIASVKIKAKAALVKIGAIFYQEVRKKELI